MLDFQAVRLLHRHGNGEYATLREVPEQSVAKHDPERAWMRGAKLYACEGCEEEIVMVPPAGTDSEAPRPGA
jgi:hypothetical protein